MHKQTHGSWARWLVIIWTHEEKNTNTGTVTKMSDHAYWDHPTKTKYNRCKPDDEPSEDTAAGGISTSASNYARVSHDWMHWRNPTQILFLHTIRGHRARYRFAHFSFYFAKILSDDLTCLQNKRSRVEKKTYLYRMTMICSWLSTIYICEWNTVPGINTKKYVTFSSVCIKRDKNVGSAPFKKRRCPIVVRVWREINWCS